MARKAANSKELGEESKPKEKAKQTATAPRAPRKTPAKRKKSSKSAADVRVKLYWGVFSQSLKRVALYEHSQKKQADKKAAELTAAGKTPHFVQKVKEPVEEKS